MPAVDLNAILTPIVEVVRDTFFPDLVDITTRDRDSVDANGQPVPDFPVITSGVPALIAAVNKQGGSEIGGEVITNVELVSVLMAGELTVPLDGRLIRQGGGVWDVVGVKYDPTRVITIVTARHTEPD